MNDVGERTVGHIVDAVSPDLAEHAASHDADNRFVREGFSRLREAGFFSAGVPRELGGLGASHAEMCDALRRLAHACPATALAASMHSHLVAASVWKHLHGKGGTGLLRKVAEGELVLVSTGASDWLQSNGTLERVEGGYRLTGKKPFASGSPMGDLMITSAVYADPERGERVLHFPVPFRAEGVRPGDDWDAHGMRGTGSSTVSLERVFVPDDGVVLDRPREGWHPVWSVVLTVAAPMYTSPYVGIAESARNRAVERCRRHGNAPHVPMLVGEMDNALASARTSWRALVDNAAAYDFAPDIERAGRALTLKTLSVNAARATVDKAMEAVGGTGYFRKHGIERLLRDVRAGAFHPLPERRQQQLTGRLALGLEPVPPGVR